MDIQSILGDIQGTVSLYGELLLCIVAAAVLGFVAGKMISHSAYRRNLQDIISTEKSSYASLQESARRETEALEDQLQALARESKTLKTSNKALKDSQTQNDVSVQQARAETIELNRQQAETHARLQRVIQQKDLEIIRLGNKLSGKTDIASEAPSEIQSQANGYSFAMNDSELTDNELDDAATVAIVPSHNDFDATVQMTADSYVSLSKCASEKLGNQQDAQDSSDELTDPDQEDGTVALDDEAIAFARRLDRSKPSE